MADLGTPVRVSPLIKVKALSIKFPNIYLVKNSKIHGYHYIILVFLEVVNNIGNYFSFNLILHFKFGRWSFLAVGVAYGAYHQSRLSKKAGKEREIEGQKKIVRDAQLAEEKKRAAERES